MMKSLALLAALAFALAGAPAAQAAEGDVVRTVRVEKTPEVHDWHPHNKVGLTRGAFLGVKNNNRALIEDPSGEVLEVPLFHITALDLSYILNRMARFPEEIAVKERTQGPEPIVALSADDLKPGPLETWENDGALGGAFHSMNVPPTVEEVAGGKGVRFDYSQWYIDPEYTAMTADVLAPQSLAPGEPFTLSVRVLHPEDPDTDDPETIMSWHAIGGDNGTSINWKGGAHVAGMGQGAYVAGAGEFVADAAAEPQGEWTNMTYVYTGGLDGTYNVYENGVLKQSFQYEHLPALGEPTNVTTNSATLNGTLNVREGGQAYVVAYLGEKDCHYWWQMRHISHWDMINEVGWTYPGAFSARFEGLKPGTRYYYRMLSLDDDSDWWNYAYGGRQWANGVRSFVTPSEEGGAAQVDPLDEDRHLFLGVQWGSRWYQSYAGPSGWYRGYIGDLRLYDHAMDELAVRKEIGLVEAFEAFPADGAEIDALRTTLRWRGGAKDAASFRVHFGTDREAVLDGSAVLKEASETTVEDLALAPGAECFWRVEQLDADGRTLTPGALWSFKVTKGEAFNPFPEDGATVNLLGDFRWSPGGPYVKEQRMYLAKSREDVLSAKEPVAVHRTPDRPDARPGNGWRNVEALEPGETYFWRVASVQEDGSVTPGAVWTFTVADYFTPEADGPVSEPYFEELQPGRPGARVMEGLGHPSVSTPGANEEDLRAAAYGLSRYLYKSEELRRRLMATPCAATIDTFEGPAMPHPFHCGAYGGIPNWTMTLHEMGHQVLMNGLGPMREDFYDRLTEVFLAHGDNNAWLGDYAASNIHENIAVSGDTFTRADGRENLRESDPPTFHLLSEFISGDLYVDLHPADGLHVDSEGRVLRWENRGGLQTVEGNRFVRIPESTGAFEALGDPRRETVEGATAVVFDGDDALAWDKRTMWSLQDNRAWSVELWARRDAGASDDDAIFGWGSDASGARIGWDAVRLGGKRIGAWSKSIEPGAWRHLAIVFEGGGLEDGEGALRVYLDGEPAHESLHKLALEPEVQAFVGGVAENGVVREGLHGAVAHVRAYDYAISPEQVRDHVAAETPAYRRDALHAAGRLYVDLDVRQFGEPGSLSHRPLYDERMHKPWLRSWANLGTLEGRLHNDVHDYWRYSGSTPLLREREGVRAPNFFGKDRMVSGFTPSGAMLSKAPGTLEAWVYSEAADPGEVVLEWGDFRLTADAVPPGAWRHLGVLFSEGSARLFIDGLETGTVEGRLAPKANERLHVGGHYDPVRWSWKQFFNGAVASLRVHEGALTPEQLAENFRRGFPRLPRQPLPADGATVAAVRQPALGWFGAESLPVRLGDSPGALETLGTFEPGECKPDLEPGRTVYWQAGDGPVWSFRTPEGLVLDMTAAELADGEVGAWKNAGRAGGAFVPARRDEAFAPVVKRFNGRKGLWLRPGKTLVSSFDAPENVNAGAFTLVYDVALESSQQPSAVLSWNGARVFYGSEGGERNPCFALVDPAEGSGLNYPEGGAAVAAFWRRFVLVADGSAMRLYMNGEMVAEADVPRADAAPGRLTLGASEGRGDGMLLSGLRIYDRALSAEEAASVSRGEEAGGDAPLVAADCEALPEGAPALRLANRGALGGEFALDPGPDRTPRAETVAGVKAVVFDGESLLESDAPAPPAVLDAHPFTVEMLVRPEAGGDARLMAFNRVVTRRHTALGFEGAWGIDRENMPVGWQGGAPQGEWTHLAWVYDGGPRSTARLYRNGEPAGEGSFITMDTIGGYPMALGGVMNPQAGGAQRLFRGAIASVKVWDYARTGEEIAAQAAETLPEKTVATP